MDKIKVKWTITFETELDPNNYEGCFDGLVDNPGPTDFAEFEKSQLEESELSVEELIDDNDITVSYKILA